MARKTKQLEFIGTKGWGGKRQGAGRKNLSGQVNHMARPKISKKFPLNITLRLKERLPSLRNKKLLKEFKKALLSAKSFGLYINQFSIQDNHVHILGECESNEALGSGMRSLAGKFAKAIHKYVTSKSENSRRTKMSESVFKGRYHIRVLKTPAEVKNALEYVLLNKAKHMKVIENLDWFSSGYVFKDWATLLGRRFAHEIKRQTEFLTAMKSTDDLTGVIEPPQSWLGAQGWKRACG